MKQFEVSDFKSANKIGVDGVMIASWCLIPEKAQRILDVGCGCGIMTLMLAQRAEEAVVDGIDIDPEAIEEAKANASDSPFADRINIYELEFDKICEDISNGLREPYDLIVSNPPFFKSGVDPTYSKRMLARHSGSLSPDVLIAKASECLSNDGLLAFIAPAEMSEHFIKKAPESGLAPERICNVRGNPEAPYKRTMLCFRNIRSRIKEPLQFSPESFAEYSIVPEPELLTIEYEPGKYTEEYIELGRPFYLKF